MPQLVVIHVKGLLLRRHNLHPFRPPLFWWRRTLMHIGFHTGSILVGNHKADSPLRFELGEFMNRVSFILDDSRIIYITQKSGMTCSSTQSSSSHDPFVLVSQYYFHNRSRWANPGANSKKVQNHAIYNSHESDNKCIRPKAFEGKEWVLRV